MLLIPGIVGSNIFDPRKLPNLKLWLDASDTSTISVSGSDVTQWTDKSTNAYTFTQATAAYRPQSGTRTQNSRNVIDWGTNDRLVSTNSAGTWKFLHDGTDHTIFFAFKSDANGSTQFVLNTNNGSSANVGMQGYKTSADAWGHFITRGVSGSLVVSNSTANSSLGTAFDYIAILNDPDNATAANRSDIRIKQGSAIKNNAAANAVSTSDPIATLSIGDYLDGDNRAFDGMVAEIIIYTSVLSASNLLSVQQYLARKWNV